MQIIRSAKVHSVVIIGSGASGGMAAWNLTRQGVDVVVLDAGTKFDRAKFWTHVRPWEARERRARGEAPPQFFLDTKEQPYASPDERPFDLYRVWGHGGKTNIWGRVSLRLSDLDFKGAARDGWEIPWPISYADIAPYYDKVEQLIGVCGGTDDSDSLPGSRFMQPAPAPRCGERILQKSAKGLGIDIVVRPPRQHDEADPRLPRLPLLRHLRRRLRHRVVLQLRRSPAAVRAEDRQARDPLERGRRPRPRRRQGPRQGRPVLRSPERRRARGAGQGRRGRRQLRRLDAHPAQLEVRPPTRTASATAPTSSAATCASRSASTSAAGCRSWPAARRATIAASAASTSTCRASTIATATGATTCAASACSSGTPAPAPPARTAAAS